MLTWFSFNFFWLSEEEFIAVHGCAGVQTTVGLFLESLNSQTEFTTGSFCVHDVFVLISIRLFLRAFNSEQILCTTWVYLKQYTVTFSPSRV